MAPAFTELPTEILDAIFLDLDPQTLISTSQTNKLIKKLTADAPIVWRHFCKTHFKWWAPRHDIAAKFAGPLADVDWRDLFLARVKLERETLRLLDLVLATQQNRTGHIDQIAEFGYDVKETLLKECACPDDAEDVLARRYYANAILERIQREMAIRVWRDMFRGEDVPIERALGAYDIFAQTGEEVDLDSFTEKLDDLGRGLVKEHPDFHELNTRRKASILATYLRGRGFKGVSDASYRALRNSFIGITLRSSTHESLPLISVAIYCALAQRLGLEAKPCGFLFHVYCIVYAPKDYSLDGDYKPTSSSDQDSMYLDPFRSSDEVEAADLQRALRGMGVPTSDHLSFLTNTDTREMVLRTARNIMNSVQTIRQTDVGLNGISSNWVNSYPDMDNSFYATIWAMMMLGPGEDALTGLSNPASRRRQYLPYLLEHFQTHYPWDVTLLEHYVIPFFYNQPEGQRLVTFVHSTHNMDRMPKPVCRRSTRSDKVTFKVGQLFKHKRYSYEGVITGWDTSCDAGEEWIQNMGVDRLPNGREQSFYHVLCCDKSIRYVAQENIAPVDDWEEPSPALLKLAGRHFKRWDYSTALFVSNVRDEYPDD